MAKITTKKPGSGGTPPEKEQVVISTEPVPAPKKLVETAAVPNKNAPLVEPKSTPSPVKVTRPVEVKSKSFSPPPARPVYQEPKKSKGGNLFVALGGVILIVVSLTKLNAGPKNFDSEFLPSDKDSREMLIDDDRSRLAMSAWKNEEPGFFGRFFQKLCLGYAKSDGCSSKPLHPLNKVAEQLGIQLKFEKEEDNKVIEQTIEYKSRAFTFNK